MGRLANQAAVAVHQSAESSHRAVSTLEGHTREAFGRTEKVLGTMQGELLTTIETIALLRNELAQE